MAENNNEKTIIDVDFVDEEKQEQEEPKATDLVKVEDKPRGPIRKAVDWVTTPFRFIYKKAKESPVVKKAKESPVVAGLGGAVLGAAAGVGGKTLYDHLKGKKSGFIPAEPIEVPDDGESYVETGSSYESTEE